LDKYGDMTKAFLSTKQLHELLPLAFVIVVASFIPKRISTEGSERMKRILKKYHSRLGFPLHKAPF
jgi:hypothetical protein